MTDIDSLAAALFGSKRAESQEVLTDATTRTYVGTALTDSKDGTVMVDLGGDVTLPDDVEGVSEHSAEGIEVSTGPGVRAGDEVVVTLVGGTPLKTPMVTGVAGEGDDQDARIATASAAAEEAWQWADEAHTAATDAQASASAAQESASSAASAASSAVSSAARAEQSAQQAIGDAARAESAAQQAVEDAADAAQAAGEAKTSAQQAVEEANEAHDAATAAQAEASRASQSATEAKGAATRANTAANDALAQVATVEDVIGVVDWVTEHGTYSLTTDTAIDPDKVYYTRTGSGTQADPYLYTAVPEPVAEDLGTYYELSVQEALSQFVASHLALTNAGLYVLKDASGYRLLLANDGMRVIDPAGHTVATYGESITFDSERPQRIGGTDSYIEWRDTNGDGVPDSLAIVADSIELGSGQSVSTGSGNVWANHTSATSASGISSWSDSFVAPTTAKPYVWMKSYSVIDGQRVYGNPACITGAKGADGTSVSVTSIEYATSTTESQPSSGWSTTAPSTVAEGSWLWTRVNYSDGSAAVSRAKQGKSGTSGSSSYTHIRYSAQADGTGFVSTPTASTVYVGIAVTSSSSAPTAKGSYTWSRYVGQQGPQGPQGKTGETGVGVESYAQMWAKSTSKTTAPTSGWSESRPTSIGTNEYLWVRIDTTWTDGSTTQGTPVVDLNVTDLWHTSAALRVDVDSIDSDVEGLKTTVSGHTTTIQQHTTSIGQNTDAIALRATKTEVQQVRPAYATSTTGAGTAAKVATIDPAVTGYALYKGASVAVTFSTANTAATPTLNLNSTGAKQIRSYTGATLSEAEYKWAAGATIDLVYDGTYWRMQDGGSVKRVTAAEASIKVNADNIESKVSKDGVISSINQSAETVKIQASKVEIDGTAVFNAISSDVDDAITGKGYQTSSQVESAITSKGYQTSSQVNSAITSKGYATTTQAQGYASTAKSEAISAAASDATTKANAAQTAATNAANEAYQKLRSQGIQLVTNGNGFMGDNTNWPTLTFDGSKSNGSPGSFTKGVGYATVLSAEMFPVDVSKEYLFEFDAISSDGNGRLYSLLDQYDVDGKSIRAENVLYFANTLTTLAKDLNTGDTTVTLTSASNWASTSYDYQRALIFWDYKNSYGYTYPTETYSRNYYDALYTDDSKVNKSTGVITLKKAWAGPKKAKGTYVSQGRSGNNYVYAHTYVQVPTEWTHYSFVYSGLDLVKDGADGIGTFRQGTAFAKAGFLWNYNYPTVSQGQIWVTNVSVKEATAKSSNAVKRTQRIWYRTNASSAPATPGTASSNWVTKADDGNDAWTKMHIAISSTHKYIYTCEQYEMANGTVGYTSVLLDNTITVIDGGNIITGSVTANKLNAANINASKTLTVGAMTDAAASTILNSNVVVGGRNLLRDTDILRTDGSYWHFAGGNTIAVTTNNSDPDGGNNATLVTVSGAADHYISYRAQPITELGWYTFSIWMKASAGHNLRLTLENNGEYRKTCALTTSWQRFDMSFNITTLSTTNYLIIGGYSSWTGATPNIYFYHPKLEKGNKATDWTPAPEDMATAESLAGTNESLEGAIEDIGELSDQLVGTITEQNKTITTIQTYLNSLRKDLDAEIQSRQQWLNFNAAEGLVIGAAGSSFKTVTTNTSQQFRSGGTVLAETSGTEFVAPVMRSDQLLIGNWMWTRRDNGNLSLKWIG